MIKLTEEKFKNLIDSENYATEYEEIEKIRQEITDQSIIDSLEFVNVNECSEDKNYIWNFRYRYNKKFTKSSISKNTK